MFSRVALVLRLRALGRRDHLDDRATVLLLFARFVDELGSGLLVLLVPSLRSRLGLSVQQVGWCFQAMASVGAVVEPVGGLAIDHLRRRPLLVGGAAAWGAALLLAAGATGFGWLLAAFALVGVAYGPLANTADVVLVEAHPDTAERIASRSTALDTVGALLAPAAVAAGAAAGLDARALLVAAGTGVLAYAVLLAGSVLPPPAPRHPHAPARAEVLSGVRAVVSDRRARRWLGALLLVESLDPIEVFEPVWLSDVVGATTSQIALHVAVGTVATLVALLALDRVLERVDGPRILVLASAASLVLFPAWLFVPGYAAKLVLVALRNGVTAPLWPIVHARALSAVPGRAGAVTAVAATAGLVPLHAAFAWLAGRVGMTSGMLWLQIVATAMLFGLARREARGVGPPPEASAPVRR